MTAHYPNTRANTPIWPKFGVASREDPQGPIRQKPTAGESAALRAGAGAPGASREYDNASSGSAAQPLHVRPINRGIRL